MGPYRIFLADDHVLLRQGIKSIIETAADMMVVGEASDGLELLNLLKKTVPDMVILDISMPNLRGFEATREIKMSDPQVKVLILSMHKGKEYLYRSFSAGASGYLLKEDSDTELFTAIESVRKGKTYISPLLQREITSDLIRIYSGDDKLCDDPLTTREREVLKLIAEGKASKEVAELLFISTRTVEHHRASIMKKLNLNTVADLVKYALQKGYTTLGI